MGYHKIQEGQRYLFSELDKMLSALQSGKAKLTPQSAVALSSILQQLEMGKLFKALEKHGGIDQFLDSLMGQDSHGQQHKMGFQVPHHGGSHGGGMYPYRQHPMMESAVRRGRRSYRTRGDYPSSDYDRMDMDMDRYDMDADMDMDMDYADHDDHMEMARRGRKGRRLPPRDRFGRFKKRGTRGDLDSEYADMRMDISDDVRHALESAMRTVRYDMPHSDTRTDMRQDQHPHNDGRTAPLR